MDEQLPVEEPHLELASQEPVYEAEVVQPASSLSEQPIHFRRRSTWCPCDQIISPERADRMGGIKRITVHHDGVESTKLQSIGAARERIRAIQRGHLGRRWADIGYHTMIDPLGNIWQGRPVEWQGAHVKHHNEQNMGVAVMGDFNRCEPTEAAMAALAQLIRYQMRVHNIPVDGVHTHCEFSRTSCPGKNLQRQMDRMRKAGGPLLRG